MSATIVHVLSHEGQPYGSERRSCNYCGTMIWGPSAPRFVDNWEDWRSNPDNCGVSRSRPEPDILVKHIPSAPVREREGIPLLVMYVGGLEPIKDNAIRFALGDFVTGMGYLFTTHERDVTATVPEADLPRVLGDLREIVGVTVKMKVGRAWVPVPEVPHAEN